MFYLKFRRYTRGDYAYIFKYIQMQGKDGPFCVACKKNTVLKYYFRVWDSHETRQIWYIIL